MNRGKFFFWLWLVGGSWWLALFLGSAMANVAEIYRYIRGNRQLFDISDAERVRVSTLANSLGRMLQL